MNNKVSKKEIIEALALANELIRALCKAPYMRGERELKRIQQYGIELPYKPLTEDEILDIKVRDGTMREACADGGGIPFSAIYATEKTVLARLGVVPKDSLSLSNEEAERIRQWFNAMSDTNKYFVEYDDSLLNNKFIRFLATIEASKDKPC